MENIWCHHNLNSSTSNTHIAQITSILDARPIGNNRYICHCPGPLHRRGDRHASLFITTGSDGKVLIICRAGCPTEAVLKAVGLTFRDLYTGGPPPTRARRQQIQAERDRRECKRLVLNLVQREAAARNRERWNTYRELRDRLVVAPEGEEGDQLAALFHEALDRLRIGECEYEGQGVGECEKLAMQRREIERLDDFFYRRLHQLQAAKRKEAA